MFEFIAKSDTTLNKYVKKGEAVMSDLRLDIIYPDIFMLSEKSKLQAEKLAKEQAEAEKSKKNK